MRDSLTCPKTWGKCSERLKVLKKRPSFISLNTSLCGPRQKSKMKTTEYEITCHILIIPWNPNISHCMTSTKTLLKGPQRQGMLKIELFPG